MTDAVTIHLGALSSTTLAAHAALETPAQMQSTRTSPPPTVRLPPSLADHSIQVGLPLLIMTSNTRPFGKHAPSSTSIRQYQASPDASLSALDNRLPCTSIATLQALTRALPSLFFPHQSQNLSSRSLYRQFGRFFARVGICRARI